MQVIATAIETPTSLFREQFADWRHLQGADSPRVLAASENLGIALYREGRLAEAEKLERETLGTKRHVLGPDHPLTLTSMNNLAEIFTRRDDYSAAEKLLNDAKAAQVRVLGPDHPGTALTTYNLACLELRRGRPTEAIQLLREAVDHGLEHWIAVAMPKDPDLKALQGDPRFVSLVNYASKRRTAASGSR